MENKTYSPTTSAGKIYDMQAIVIATFIGGIFSAAYLLAANFKTFGLRGKVVTTWFNAIILFAIIIGTAFIPELDKIPNLVYNIAVAIAVAIYASVTQKSLLDEHLSTGGAKHKIGRVIVVALLGLALTVALALIGFIMADIYVSEP